jgi:hypothetical protein
MRPRARFRRCVAVASAVAVFALPASLSAQETEEPPQPAPPKRGILTNEQIDTGFGVVFDLLVLRPLGLVGLGVGVVLYVPCALVSLADRDALTEATELFVIAPAQNVFTRRLGDF